MQPVCIKKKTKTSNSNTTKNNKTQNKKNPPHFILYLWKGSTLRFLDVLPVDCELSLIYCSTFNFLWLNIMSKESIVLRVKVVWGLLALQMCIHVLFNIILGATFWFFKPLPNSYTISLYIRISDRALGFLDFGF